MTWIKYQAGRVGDPPIPDPRKYRAVVAVELTQFSLGVAFTLGLVSTLHCLGMCGGIITALSLGAAPGTGPGRRRMLILSYNAGRVFSYGIAGGLAGAAGKLFASGPGGGPGYLVLQGIAGAVLVAVGLNLCGWLPRARSLERIGWRLWQVIQPLGRRFVPVDGPAKAILLGMIWGWLPCGLVYSMLLWAAAQGDPLSGAGALLCFGAGTIPGMVIAGMTGDALRQRLRSLKLRRVAGLLVIAIGIASPLVSASMHHGDPHPHAYHLQAPAR